jgi:hypothetical protein
MKITIQKEGDCSYKWKAQCLFLSLHLDHLIPLVKWACWRPKPSACWNQADNIIKCSGLSVKEPTVQAELEIATDS